MTEKLTRTEVEALMARLADKTLSFGCLCQNNWSDSHDPYIFIRKSGKYTVFWSKQFKKEIRIETKLRGVAGTMDRDREPYKIIGHEIMLGDVLEKIYPEHDDCADMENDVYAENLISKWKRCGFTRYGFTKSLQTIVKENGWETKTYCGECGEEECSCITQKWTEEEVLKSEEANALLVFIDNLLK